MNYHSIYAQERIKNHVLYTFLRTGWFLFLGLTCVFVDSIAAEFFGVPIAFFSFAFYTSTLWMIEPRWHKIYGFLLVSFVLFSGGGPLVAILMGLVFVMSSVFLLRSVVYDSLFALSVLTILIIFAYGLIVYGINTHKWTIFSVSAMIITVILLLKYARARQAIA